MGTLPQVRFGLKKSASSGNLSCVSLAGLFEVVMGQGADLLGHKTCLGACLQAKVFVPDLNGNPPLKYRVGHTHLEKPLLEDIQAAAL